LVGIEHYSVFIVTGIMLNVIPGSDTIYILSRTITQGKRAGIYSLLGIILGALVHTLLAALLSDFMTKSMKRSRIASYLNRITGVVFILLGLNILRANRGS
jgi:threonine/homoserine/homoserine lactone efflux protein